MGLSPILSDGLSALVGYASGSGDLECRQDQYPQVEHETLTSQILGVIGNFQGNFQFIPSIYLGPACQPRLEGMDACFCAGCNQVILVEKGRARADEAHLTFEDAPELRKFVQAALSQEAANRCEMPGRIGQEMGGDNGGVGAHGSELRHQKDAVVLTDASRPINYGSGRGQTNGKGDDDHRDCQDEPTAQRNKNIDHALYYHNATHLRNSF